MATETKSVGLRVNVTPSDYARLLREAERLDVSVANVARKALRAYLKGKR